METAPIDPSTPHSARVWNYWLQGKDNYPADRAVGEKLKEMMPSAVISARADREFLERVVSHMVCDRKVTQFLDVGTGLPTANNTHEVAQAANPSSRIVYVDNDPLVLAHARALLTSTDEGSTDYLHADVHDPEEILTGARGTLDLRQPVCLMLLGVLNYVVEQDDAVRIVRHLVEPLASGSHVVVGHPTGEFDPEGMQKLLELWNDANPAPMRARNRDEVTELLAGLEILEPGVVSCSRWRPNQGTLHAGRDVSQLAAVARKP